jgi:hypothetical protein
VPAESKARPMKPRRGNFMMRHHAPGLTQGQAKESIAARVGL